MNLSEANTLITFNTNATTTDFPASERIIFVNSALDEIHTDILQSLDGWDYDDKNATDFPILTANLIADQADYPLPLSNTGSDDDAIRIKRVETKMSSTFYKAEPFDLGERGISMSETSGFFEAQPKYDVNSGSVFLYPTPSKNVTGGLKIWIDRSLPQFAEADLSSTSKYFGFDRQFHELVPLKVSLSWAMIKTPSDGKIGNMVGRINQLTEKMKTFYGTKQQDREIVIKAGFIDYDTDSGGYGNNRQGSCS